MDLITTLAHLRNKKIQVGHDHISVDARGVVRVSDKVGKELLKHHNGTWRHFDEATAKGDEQPPPGRRERQPAKSRAIVGAKDPKAPDPDTDATDLGGEVWDTSAPTNANVPVVADPAAAQAAGNLPDGQTWSPSKAPPPPVEGTEPGSKIPDPPPLATEDPLAPRRGRRR